MFIFGLHSTSDDWPSNWRDESHLKCEKMAAKSSKNEMLAFGLHLTSDDWLSNESHLKCEKMAAKSSKNKCLMKVAEMQKTGHQIVKK